MLAGLFVVIIFTASLILADGVNQLYVKILQPDAPPRLVGAFTEPFTTKLIPACIVVLIHRHYEIPSVQLESYPYGFGFLGGLSLGVVERLLYLTNKGATVTLPFAVVPVMHALNGALVAGLVFRSVNRRWDFHLTAQVLIAVMLTIAIHAMWNLFGVVLVHRIVV